MSYVKSSFLFLFLFFILIFILVTAFGNNIASAASSSANNFQLNKLNFCKLTPKATNDYEPEKFEKTNNLLRGTGQESLFCGEKIIITGSVVDQNCVPIGDAKVYIWQADCKGKYPYIPLKNNLNSKLIGASDHRITFTGNGSATTNNKGEFHFITVYPHPVHGVASHVNVRIEHRKLGTTQVRLILKGNKLEHPEYYPELSPINQIAVKNNISVYNYKIVISGDSEDDY